MARPRKYTPEQAAQRAAESRERYKKKHPANNYRYQKKSRAKSFIKNDATREELEELQALISERLKTLEN